MKVWQLMTKFRDTGSVLNKKRKVRNGAVRNEMAELAFSAILSLNQHEVRAHGHRFFPTGLITCGKQNVCYSIRIIGSVTILNVRVYLLHLKYNSSEINKPNLTNMVPLKR